MAPTRNQERMPHSVSIIFLYGAIFWVPALGSKPTVRTPSYLSNRYMSSKIALNCPRLRLGAKREEGWSTVRDNFRTRSSMSRNRRSGLFVYGATNDDMDGTSPDQPKNNASDSSIEQQIIKTTRNVLSGVVNSIRLALQKRIVLGGSKQTKDAKFWNTAEEVFIITFTDGGNEMIYYNIVQQDDGSTKEVIVAFESYEATMGYVEKLKKQMSEPGTVILPPNGKIKSLPPSALLKICQENGMYVTLQKKPETELPKLVEPPKRDTLAARLDAIRNEKDPQRRMRLITLDGIKPEDIKASVAALLSQGGSSTNGGKRRRRKTSSDE
mmetsp:Transcript_25112/g.40566  ORF Transcript_25112/g.40566 Transcript_25112/m.40566 type:complete len:326 (+) Transcript_25112:145-1122(+)